ncbi:MAG: hypothetical protein JWO33_2427 [Caulobacteraceae bacterium]|nr:hypothetical protein [Caulobacteraceae bacterium]
MVHHGPVSSLQTAELDYDAACRTTPGVTRADVDLDLLRLDLIASACAETARKAWREYRATSDPGSRREFQVSELARQFTDAVADSLGFSREAAVVLDELTKAQFA